MNIRPGYIGWPNGLSIAWGVQHLKGTTRFVSVAWRSYVIGFYVGNVRP